MLNQGRYRRSAHQSAFRLELTPLRSSEVDLRVVVSTKVTKKAVERNRLKRRLREIWRALSPIPLRPPASPGYRVTVYTKKIALETGFSDLSRQLIAGLKQL